MQIRRHQQLSLSSVSGDIAAVTPPPPAPPPSTSSEFKRGRKRGSYNCGRCGLPKRGHVCNLSPPDESSAVDSTPEDSSLPPPPPPPCFSHLRRALSFDEVDNGGGLFDADPPGAEDDGDEEEEEENEDEADGGDCGGRGDQIYGIGGGLPASCLWEVLRRLTPAELLSAAKVCRGWRSTTKRLWKAAEVLRLRVPAGAQVGLVGSMLHKCSSLLSLSLRMESDVDATMLACVAFSCPNLEYMEISMSDCAVNRITGDELGRFVSNRQSLKSLKMEGCSNLGNLLLCSTSLSTLWLSDLCSLSKSVFNCPNLLEISLEFVRQDNDNHTDLTALTDHLGRGCPRLQNIHIASYCLSNAVVLSLAAAQLRGLRMLSLVLGSEITDASVAAISSSYPNLELLDLSGSGISDSGLGMICNVFPDTLTRLLVALCPNITSSGIQFVTAQLPLLELMDCGMTICDPNSASDGTESGKAYNTKVQIIYQKLIIKHSRLKKLSLWGCSGLDALNLNCPQLKDLNLNSCKSLHPDRLLLQCPNLSTVHAKDCEIMLGEAIKNQVNDSYDPVGNVLMCKRLADGSKRIRIQHYLDAQSYDMKQKKVERRKCNVLL